MEKPERNFIVLSEMQSKDGIITNFVPTLKDAFSAKINVLLNECEFLKASIRFKDIIPDYSKDMAIYCVCGEIAEINNVQICNWRNSFKFYLFEANECKCGESIYVLSLMDETAEVPGELSEIFSS